MTRTKHQVITVFCVLLSAFCIIYAIFAVSANAQTSRVYDISNGTLTIDESNLSTYNVYAVYYNLI